jgi:hypothetical protein
MIRLETEARQASSAYAIMQARRQAGIAARHRYPALIALNWLSDMSCLLSGDLLTSWLTTAMPNSKCEL